MNYFFYFLALSFAFSNSYVARGGCEELFYEKQLEAMELFDLEIVVATGGSSKIYFTHSPVNLITVQGENISAGDPVLVKLPLTPAEAKMIESEIKFIETMARSKIPDLFVDAVIHDTGAMVMPYNKLQLRTLDGWINPKPKAPLPELTPKKLESIRIQLESSLAELRSMRVVHSDLKPENILVEIIGGDQVRIKIIDFGISLNEGAAATDISRGGTPPYASENQRQNGPAKFSDDNYAVKEILLDLGAVLQP